MGTPSRRTATVVWAGMLVGALLLALATAAAPRPEAPSEAEKDLLLWMTAGLVGVGVVLSRAVPRLASSRGAGGGAFGRLVVAWAIGEGAAIFPLVTRVVTGDPRLLLLFAVALASLATLYPTEDRWAAHGAPGGGAGGGNG